MELSVRLGLDVLIRAAIDTGIDGIVPPAQLGRMSDSEHRDHAQHRCYGQTPGSARRQKSA
jgi:hypothetical protein